MPPMRLCIFARPMSRRQSARPLVRTLIPLVVLSAASVSGGCKDIEGRNNNRQGNAYYRDSKFIDAAVEYERALKKVDDPVIHYNLGLAYSKMFRGDEVVLVGLKEDPVCQIIPSTVPVNRRVCVKPGDRSFNKCDEKKEAPELTRMGDLVTPHFRLGSSAKRTDDVCAKLADYQAAADAIAKMAIPGNVDEIDDWKGWQKDLAEQVKDVAKECKGVADARSAIEEQKKATEAAKAAEEARKAAEEAKKAAEEAKKAKGRKKDVAKDAGSAAGSAAGAPAETAKTETEEPKEDPKPDLTNFDKAFLAVRDTYENLVGGKLVCSVEAKCMKVDMCAIESMTIAEQATKHLEQWVKVQPPDTEIDKELAVLRKELQSEESKPTPQEIKDQLALARGQLAEAQGAARAELEKEISRLSSAPTRDEAKTTQLRKDIDELNRKFDTRNQMTTLWLDSGNHKGALTYWEGMLKAEPQNTDFMEMLAGINAKSGEWRTAIDWYNKVAEQAKSPEKKVSAWTAIGNIAWSKLNSRLLDPGDSLAMADYGIGALQRAFELDKNVKLLRQTAALLHFRSLTHGASFAGAIDRATGQDLVRLARVMDEEAKKLQGTPASGEPSAPTPAPATAPASGSGSAKGTAEQPSPSSGATPTKAGG